VPRQPLTARNMNSTAATVSTAVSSVHKDVSVPTAAATAVNRAVTGSGIANNVMAGVNSALGYDYRSTTTTTTTTASSAAIATTAVSARSHSVLPSLVRPATASVLTATTASLQQRNKQAFEIFADPSGAAAVTAKAVTGKAVTSRGGVTAVSSSGISKSTPPRTAYVSSSEQQQQCVATAHLASVRAARTTSAAAVAAAADKENAYSTTATTARATTVTTNAAVSKQPVKLKHNVYPLSGKVKSVASPSFGATSSATKAYQRSRAAALSTRPNGTTAGTNTATTTAVRRLHSSPMSVEKPQQQQQQYADAVDRYRSKSASVKLGTITNNNNNSDNMDVSCNQMTAAAAVTTAAGTTATPPPVTAAERYQSGSYKSDDMSPADSASDRNKEQQAAAAAVVVAVKTPAAKRGDAMQTSDSATTVNASAKGSGKQPDTIMCMHKRLASVTDTADSNSSDTRLITSALARATISDSLPPLAQQQQQQRPVSVTRYVDYTSKYGIGFLLSDGSAGVYFNDATKMVIAAEGEMFQYIERTTAKTVGKAGSSSSGSSDVHNYTLSEFPVALQKKTTLLTHFRNYLREQSKDCVNTPSQRSVAAAAAAAAANNGSHVAAGSGNGSAADACLVHVKKFVRTRHAILFRLSNRSVQVVFFDQTEVLLVDEARSVTYVDKAGVREHMLLCDVKGSKRADLIKRLQYTKDMMGQLIAPVPQAATAR
jgi:POLO box duplicated region